MSSNRILSGPESDYCTAFVFLLTSSIKHAASEKEYLSQEIEVIEWRSDQEPGKKFASDPSVTTKPSVGVPPGKRIDLAPNSSKFSNQKKAEMYEYDYTGIIDLTKSSSTVDSVKLIRAKRELPKAKVTARDAEKISAKNETIVTAPEITQKLTVPSGPQEIHQESPLCIVCQEKDRDAVFLPCRHLCTCNLCATSQLLKSCPLCRKNITAVLRVFA